jgi:hypothetical protein
MSNSFKLLVPCGYGSELKVAGPLGIRPDTRFVSLRQCERVGLPRSLDRSTFIFPRLPHAFPAYADKEIIQNFYHQGEYFVVTASLLEFLRKKIPDGLQTAPLDVRHDDGREADEPYFAAKIARTIDCIDRAASMAKINFMAKESVPFERAMVSFDLGEEAAREFANAEGAKYVSFPSWHEATMVRLMEERIPSNVAVFQPTFWPNHLLTTRSFADELESRCRGGTRGYYFWTLGLDNPSTEHNELMRSLR